MVYKIDINYKISGLGTYEETTLCGYEENFIFYLGNGKGIEILIKAIDDEKVTLEIQDNSMLSFIDSNNNLSKSIELRVGEKAAPYLPIEPSPTYEIKITDIRKENKLYFE